MANGFSKNYKWGTYRSNPPGVKSLALEKSMKKATGDGAARVISAARSLDPKGDYTAKGIGVYSTRKMEPRHGALVEGKWWPGARTAALQRAIRQVAKGARK